MVNYWRVCTNKFATTWCRVVVLAWLVRGIQGGTLFDRCEPATPGESNRRAECWLGTCFSWLSVNLKKNYFYKKAIQDEVFGGMEQRGTGWFSSGKAFSVCPAIRAERRETPPVESLARAASSAPPTGTFLAFCPEKKFLIGSDRITTLRLKWQQTSRMPSFVAPLVSNFQQKPSRCCV